MDEQDRDPALAAPIAYRFDADHHASEVLATWAALVAGERGDEPVRCAGRLMLIRRHGGLVFGVLQDRTARIQLFVDRGAVGEELYARFDALRRGDWIGVRGPVMRTDRGELSIAVDELTLLGHATRRPPDKDKAFDDIEARSRHRYLDLMVNERTRETFRVRRAVIDSIRDGLRERGFWEVEGPILQSIQGGATARPFITHHNALDLDMYLRIALELHLKRLVVGGMERVFELSRVFRNEGIDVRHNPEFTMLEAYQAFADYGDMMELVEGLVVSAARAALGEDLVVTVGDRRIDLTPPWPRITLDELIRTRLGVSMDPTMPVAEARAILDRLGVQWEPDWGSGKLMKQVVDERIQHEIVEPVFCVDYPEEVSPLARRHRSRPGYVERFELMVAGFELCNAYSEQNDPVAQLAAFEAEARAKAQGDPEAGDIDEDYVQALEYGLPATGGIGIGIDRLVMLLSGAGNIREVILFPTLRPADGGRALGPGHPLGLGRLADRSELAVAAPAEEPAAAPLGGGLGAAASAPQVDAPSSARAAPPSRRPVLVLAWLTLLGGVIQLLPLVPVLHSRLQADPLGPLWFRVTGHLVSTLLGLLLILLAGQLARAKRRAWQLSLILFGMGAAVNALKGPHPVSLAYCLVMLGALLAYDSRFRGRSDPPSLLRLLRLAPLYVAAVLVFGFVTLALGRHELSTPLTFAGGLETIVRGLVGLPGPYDYARPFFDAYFRGTLLALGVAGALGAAFLLFRPFQARQPHSAQSWERASRLVHDYGSDTLAYFALRPDKSFFFGSDGEAFVAYTYLGGYALVSGDPIGADASVDRLLDEFLAFCDGRSWKVAFLAARGSEARRYAARGLHIFYLGDEAIVECRRFSLEGPGMKGIRAAVNRVGRTHRFQLLRESQASPQLVAALNGISARWRGKAPERGFTMSLSQDVEGNGRNPEFLLCVARDEDDRPSGFLRLVPAYGEDFGYTLDLMRHLPDAPNGMTEFLIAGAAEALRAEGIDRLSMNFAMWGRLYSDDVRYSPAKWLAKRAVDVLNPFFQIKSLHDFNEKFSPRWLSRVLVFQEPTDLPQVGLLYAGAEGFLSIPVVGELFVPRAVGEEDATA
ncbi:lysine--tRNA ligase [Gryllotalpicola koreensis]|uniref:Lysine--tRNA ligase n=1 Tax=Gryllotalpicola koreensis TaxID=993086 RepID=A0ABP7ZWW0_9MICO